MGAVAAVIGFALAALPPTAAEAAPPPPVTERISVMHGGGEANGPSSGPSIDADGSAIAFSSQASNLVASDTDTVQDVFVRDRATSSTEHVSLGSGTCVVQCSSGTISDDGDRVAYLDSPFVGSSGRVWAMRRLTGQQVAIAETETSCGGGFCRAGFAGFGGPPANAMTEPQISGDGLSVVYSVRAQDLTPFGGISCTLFASGTMIQRASTTAGNVNATTRRYCVSPYDVYTASSPSPTDDGVSVAHVAVTRTTSPGLICNGSPEIDVSTASLQLSIPATADLNVCFGVLQAPAIAGNGVGTAFSGSRTDLVAGDTNLVDDVFWMPATGGPISRVSVAANGTQANGSSSAPAVSDDGRLVAFVSNASNLVPDDTNGLADIFLKDRVTGAIERISVDVNGDDANGASSEPSLSDDGCWVAFTSVADDLVAGDTNSVSDVFLRRSGLPVCNQPPVANTDMAATVVDQSVTIDVVANDVDPDGDIGNATVTLVPPVVGGSVVAGGATGEFVFNPTPGLLGTATFSYELCDETSICAVGSVTVDIVPSPVVSAGAVAVAEGDSGSVIAEVPVSLSIAPQIPLTVEWATVDTLEPEPGLDYIAASGSLTFVPGETVATVPITILGDTLDEGTLFDSEWGAIVLSDAVNGTVAPGFDALGFFLIADGTDGPPTIVPGASAILEGDAGSSVLNVPIELSAPSGKTITADWATVDTIPDLIPGVDYLPASGTVTFAPGVTTATVPVTILGDTAVEPGVLFGAEWGLVALSDPTNAVFGPGFLAGAGSFFIVDDD